MKPLLYRAFQLYSKPGRPGILPISHSTFHRYIDKGIFPRGKQLGDGCHVWEASVVESFIQKLGAR
jgi:predicted DNA-binding transcriptional regulator AlpA